MQQRKPSGWYVIYLNLSSGFFEEIAVDFVVICSGLNSLPYIPSYPVSCSPAMVRGAMALYNPNMPIL
jgi:cation diffusion facilitator CzcD-associated flavoprotein CzcO